WATRRPILVATVTPSGASLARNCPMIRSLRPSPYTSAVSRKVTPDSTAARSTARASASVTAPQSAPSCQVPRPMTDTGLPVLPRTRCSMGSDPRGGIPRPRRRPYAGIVTRPSRGSRATVRGMEGRTPPAWARVALVMFAVGWGANQFSPMLIVYRRSLGLSAGEIAGLFAIYAATLIPGLLAGGPLSDRFGRRACVLPFAALSPVATLLFVLGPNRLPLIAAGRALAGLCPGMVFGPATAWVQDLSGGDSRSARRAALALSAGFGLGPVVA